MGVPGTPRAAPGPTIDGARGRGAAESGGAIVQNKANSGWTELSLTTHDEKSYEGKA